MFGFTFNGNFWEWYRTFAPSIPVPELYWNVVSAEQRIHDMCHMLACIREYCATMGKKVDEIDAVLNDIIDGHLDPMIEQAISDWFADNQPGIMNRLDTIDAEIGTGFSAENTIANAISSTNDAIEVLAEEIDRTNARHLATVDFDVKARIMVKQSDYLDKGWQSGGFFGQNGRRYCAGWLASDTVGTVDYLLIIDMDANELVGTFDDVDAGHGQNVTYNPLTKELAFTAGSSIYFVNVADPAHPYLAHSNSTPDISGYGHPYYFAYDDTDYNHFYVLKLDNDRNDFNLLYTSTNFDLIDVIELDANAWHNRPNHQGMDVKNGILYLAVSGQETIIMCDVKTGERLNTIPVPSFIKFLPIREIEFCGVIGTTLYISQASYYPNRIAPVVFEFDMLNGNIPVKDDFWRMVTTPEDNNGQYVRVAWSSADPRNPWASNSQRPCFNFVEDAVNYAKHYGINMILTFDEDYPSFANITDINFELHQLNNAKVGGLSFNNCVVKFNGVSRLTFTGLGSSVIHSATYAHAVKAVNCHIAAYSIWSVDLDSSINKTPSNGNFQECFISSGQVSNWGVAAFQSCLIVSKANSHANVINQLGTYWTA